MREFWECNEWFQACVVGAVSWAITMFIAGPVGRTRSFNYRGLRFTASSDDEEARIKKWMDEWRDG